MLPAVCSCLLACASFSLFDFSSPDLSQWIRDIGNFDYNLFGAFVSGSFNAFVYGQSAYNTVLWTMKIELLGSMLIYALCRNIDEPKIPISSVVTLLLVISLSWTKLISLSTCIGILCFLGGYYFYRLGIKISTHLATILLVLGLYLAGAHNTSASYKFINQILGAYSYSLCNFLSSFFIVYAILFNEKFSDFFSHKAFIFLGKVSFSVYLIHITMISTLGVALFRTSSTLGFSFLTSALFASFLTIVATYTAAIFFYKLVDLNSLKISNFFATYTLQNLYPREGRRSG